MMKMMMKMIMKIKNWIKTFIMDKKKYLKENWLELLLHIILRLFISLFSIYFFGDTKTMRFDDGSPESSNNRVEDTNNNMTGNNNTQWVTPTAQNMVRGDNSPFDYPAGLTHEQVLNLLRQHVGTEAKASDPVLAKVAAQALTFLQSPALQQDYYKTKTLLSSFEWEDLISPNPEKEERYSMCLTKQDMAEVQTRIVKPGGPFAVQINPKTGERFLQCVIPFKNGDPIIQARASYTMALYLKNNPLRR